jgi:hypothetical protein
MFGKIYLTKGENFNAEFGQNSWRHIIFGRWWCW